MNLFIGCSSRDEISNNYKKECAKYLEKIFSENNNLVFGADNSGIMGISYETAKKHNRKVIGITPKAFKDASNGLECDDLIFTNNISDRTYKVIEISDALIFLPGGIGSIYEFFSSLEFIRSNEFNKPIVIYNCNHYYDDILNMLDKIYKEKFADNKLYYHVSYDAIDSMEYIKNYYIK